MIQCPRPGELLIDIPDAGTLISQHEYLQRCFGRMLLRGTEETRDGQRCVRWDLGDAQPLPPGDARFVSEADRVRSYVERSRRASDGIRRILAGQPSASHVELGPDLLMLMGLPGSVTRMPRRDVERLAQVHRLAADAVESALQSGGLVARADGSIAIIGWGFLPYRPPAPEPELALRVALEDVGQGPDSLGRWQLRWTTQGPATDIELRCRQPSGTIQSLGYAQIDDNAASGTWLVVADDAPPGAVMWAVANGPRGSANSNEVHVPAPFRASGHPVPPPLPPEPVPPPQPEPRPPVAVVARPGRRWSRPVAYSLLALLVLGLLAWSLWFFFPGRAHVARSAPVLIKPNLPDGRSDPSGAVGIEIEGLSPPGARGAGGQEPPGSGSGSRQRRREIPTMPESSAPPTPPKPPAGGGRLP